MSQYRAPWDDIEFLLEHVFAPDARDGAALDLDLARSVAHEAAKFAQAFLEPANRAGDQAGARLEQGAVVTPPGFARAYAAFREAGWNGLRHPERFGGQGLSAVLSTLTEEIWHACNASFALCPMLTGGAIEALLAAADPALQARLLPRLVSGEWTGTMNLTEPGAGSDLGAVKTRAVARGDGSYAITGQKIFITYGDHDMAANIIHLVLARTPDAPAGVQGLSLFAVPRQLLRDDGSPGEPNRVACVALEHKLGIHGSPTAVMQFGDDEGATGYLVGALNDGLKTMFVMMNEARQAVGIQGLALSERAYQHAVWYAGERRQGRIVGEDGSRGDTILRHPDVRRLLLGIKCRIDAMRALAIYLALQRDQAHGGAQAQAGAAARARLDLLVPVMKGWFTETAQRATCDAMQVFGGMGYIEETGAAQYYRDARILTIYEGTTAIQANDLVGRKTARDQGAEARRLLDEIAAAAPPGHDAEGLGEALRAACADLRAAIDAILEQAASAPRAAYAGGVPYLELWGVVAGGWMHALRARAAAHLPQARRQAVLASAGFYARHVLPQAAALRHAIVHGGTQADAYPDDCWVA
ncbi:acyl-CoA dehydrogenase [Bordetella bronchiseptica]|uniref:acyl-CoA dehydrogenase n=1 Tax=Bordetella bronchiseptica TaxID=518 RepID=UPI00045A4208|nr:acyl-CoA dehydrogenase [Bordetella bronchiseptica]KAK73698.1 putative acyl-CoA dehydrogenase [Bordetella bronchiseptica MO211]